MTLPLLPVFNSSSKPAHEIEWLFWISLIVCAVILAIVAGLIFYGLWRFRPYPGEATPEQRYGRPKFEQAWTFAPFVLLAVLFGLTVHVVDTGDPQSSAPTRLIIVGRQWFWAAHYTDGNFNTANEIHLPAGQDMWARIETADVIHDFWVPRISRKVDALPGIHNRLLLNAEQGTYLGTCAEFCGAQHANMRLRVIVSSPEAFASWKSHQRLPAIQPGEPVAMQGQKLFERRLCVQCHTIRGTEAHGLVGPDLTHFASRQMIAGEMLTNTAENVYRWLKNPQDVKPGSHMPNMQLTASQLRPLVAYLEGLQ